jgi:hypothetical protein
MGSRWGYFRETQGKAQKAGKDKSTGLHRTGLEEYLKVIFPFVKDWIHDQPIGLELDRKMLRTRPDYRSETLKLITEFDEGVFETVKLKYPVMANALRDDVDLLNWRHKGFLQSLPTQLNNLWERLALVEVDTSALPPIKLGIKLSISFKILLLLSLKDSYSS